MQLFPHVDYFNSSDKFMGFEDFGNDLTTNKFADHALVFMARRMKRQWKQVLGYTFSQGQTNKDQLSILIKEHIRQLQAAGLGLTVVGTICDQGTSNVSAIKSLKAHSQAEFLHKGCEYTSLGYFVDDQEIIPQYDPPHLIKLICNHLLEKNLIYTDADGQIKTAKWDHVLQVYRSDVLEGELRSLPKITAQHVEKNKIKKMKVRMCTQVFSHKFASVMHLLSKRSRPEDIHNPGYVEAAVTETASCFLFLDKLFDSVNGSSLSTRHDKALQCVLRNGSAHFAFWEKAISILRSMHFVDAKGMKRRPTTLDNWIATIQGIRNIWRKLRKHSFRYLILRNFNQDPLENFFECIRSHGVRNINPTPSSFQSSFKTLLLNSMITVSSVGRNCEDDHTTDLLNNSLDFSNSICERNDDDQLGFAHKHAPLVCPDISEQFRNVVNLQVQTTMYVVGYIIFKLKKDIFQQCAFCNEQLLTQQEDVSHLLISIREYGNRKSLCYPTALPMKVFQTITQVMCNSLSNVCFQIGVKWQVLCAIPENINWLPCITHPNVRDQFIDVLVCTMLYHWCKILNRRLNGTDLRVSDTTDTIHLNAITYYNKHRKYRRI